MKLDHGAGIVVHSPARYLGGHGNSIDAILADPDQALKAA